MTNRKRIAIRAAAAVAGAAVLAIGVALWLPGPGGTESAGTPEKRVWRYSIFGPPRAFTAGIERVKELMEEAEGGLGVS